MAQLGLRGGMLAPGPGTGLAGLLGESGLPGLLWGGQPSLWSKMTALDQMQKPRGPYRPGTPEYDLATEISSNFDFMGPIKAYHGTPHLWPAEEGAPLGRPRLDKVGTGEGAQAYGFGHYFAENKEVADDYRRTLAADSEYAPKQHIVFKNTGGIATPRSIGEHLGVDASKLRMSDSFDHYLFALARAGGDPDATMEMLTKQFSGFSGGEITKSRANDINYLHDKIAGKLELKPAGSLYHLEIGAEHEDLLDWDKPLSEQSEKVRKAVLSLRGVKPSEGYKGDLTKLQGATAYQLLADALGSDAAASRALREAGIPGIRYLDAGSRSGGEGTRNIVLFDEMLAKVLDVER